MKKIIPPVLLYLALISMAWAAPSLYPFPVKVGGVKAVLQGKNATFARITTPVAASAEIEVLTPSTMTIINVFACDKAGNPRAGYSPAILMIKGGSKIRLNQSMDKRTLTPGFYLMNVVANGKTSRVVFKVK